VSFSVFTDITLADNLAERLPRPKNPHDYIRIGHPCRILPSALDYSLDYQIRTSDAGQLCADIRKEMDDTLIKIKKCKR
jgi:DNA polymerase alpha-associated DNA helicase A